MNLSQAIANRFNATIFSVGGSYYDGWQPINCPFHHDENKSAGLNFDLKLFNCFGGCGTKNFVQLARELNIDDFDATGYDDYLSSTDWLSVLNLNTPIPKLSIKKQAQEYTDFLLERKLKPETIEEFGGYYVSDQSHQDYGHLVIPYGKGKYHKRRIIQSTSDNRFTNSRGNNKGLFGIGRCGVTNAIILCEGLTDYLTLWQEGIRNCIASFGAEVSKKDLYNLRGKTVFILFDRDYAGYEGARKALNYLKELGAIPIILEIPERFGNGEDKIDINSAYVHSGSEFIDWLTNSIHRYDVFDSDYINNIFLENKRTVRYVSTGISGLDNCLNGGFATGVHIIGGKPEAGKSTLITYLEDTFVQQEQSVLSLSYELTKEQKYARLASRVCEDFSWSDIEKDHSILDMYTSSWLTDLSKKLRIDNNWNIEEIKAAANNFDVIIVDYIQRMPFEDENPREAIKKNATKLSDIAVSSGKIIIMISSLPNVGDNFKETGDLKYMCQSGYILSKVTSNVCSLEMIKNTRGISKTIYLDMNYAHQRIQETTRPELTDIIKE